MLPWDKPEGIPQQSSTPEAAAWQVSGVSSPSRNRKRRYGRIPLHHGASMHFKRLSVRRPFPRSRSTLQSPWRVRSLGPDFLSSRSLTGVNSIFPLNRACVSVVHRPGNEKKSTKFICIPNVSGNSEKVKVFLHPKRIKKFIFVFNRVFGQIDGFFEFLTKKLLKKMWLYVFLGFMNVDKCHFWKILYKILIFCR